MIGGLSGSPVCKVHSLLCSPRGAWACRSEVQIPNVWFFSLDLKHTRYGKACDVWSVGVICYVLLSGSPPFYTENPRLAISPGMKRRIHSAEYTFPPAQWSHISQVGSRLIALNFPHTALYQDAKDLIKGCLRSNPEERLSIDEMLASTWLSKHISVPPTPLLTSKVLQQGNANWKLLQV